MGVKVGCLQTKGENSEYYSPPPINARAFLLSEHEVTMHVINPVSFT